MGEPRTSDQLSRDVSLCTFNVGFRFNIAGDVSTSAQFGTILAAETGYRWILDGGYIHAAVTVTLNGAAAEANLHLQDGTTVSSDSVVIPIAHYQAGASIAGTVLTMPAPDGVAADRGSNMHFSFERCPRRSLAIGNGLFVRGSNTLGAAGTIRVTGCVWGWKVAT